MPETFLHGVEIVEIDNGPRKVNGLRHVRGTGVSRIAGIAKSGCERREGLGRFFERFEFRVPLHALQHQWREEARSLERNVVQAEKRLQGLLRGLLAVVRGRVE